MTLTTVLTTLAIFLPGTHDLPSMLYWTQSMTYGLAFWAVQRGGHAPGQVYLTSCLVHLVLGIVHHLAR